jgi:hypothetical protein
LPPQLTWPAVQVTAQAPLEQTCPDPQATPQPPQFRLSVRALAHSPPQLVSPAWQESAQAPAEQTWPEAQETPAAPPVQVPEAPQNARSAIGSTHFPPQSTWPAAQVTAQAPAEQTWPEAQATPAAPPVQAPEAPQKARSVSGSLHWPLQSRRPAWQVSPHCPAEQT